MVRHRLGVSPRFLRFCVIGVAAVLVHYATMVGLKEGYGLPAPLSAGIGFCVGGVVSYVLNREFNSDARPDLIWGAIRFFIVVSVGALISAAIVSMFVYFGISYLIGQLFATVITLFWNYVFTRRFVFGRVEG